MADTSEDVKAPQYLSFRIAGTDYGLPILAVKEILEFEETTRVPGTPPSIRGIINVRGQVVPVVDLAVRFGECGTVPSKQTCILVVEAGFGAEPLTVGVLADAVNEVLDLPISEIEDPPTFGENVRLDYVIGMGKVGKQFVLLLDAERVLTASEAELAAQAREVAEASRTASGAAAAQAASGPA